MGLGETLRTHRVSIKAQRPMGLANVRPTGPEPAVCVNLGGGGDEAHGTQLKYSQLQTQ